MKKLNVYLKSLFVAVTAFVAVSCDNNDEIKVDPNKDYDAVLTVNQSGAANPNVNVDVNANTMSSIDAKVTFISSSVDMKRLYITRNINGKGEEKFEPTESIDLKADGAVDLTGKNSKNFEYAFNLPVPSGVGVETNGTVVYKFWTTTGNGDFRDTDKRLAVGPGTITLKYGTGTNPSADSNPVKSYTDVTLAAPLADGSSKTFVSLLDGKTYNVSSGIEFVSLWDFGYLYSTTDGATLRSPYDYNVPYYPGVLAQPVIDIPAKAGTTNGELNKTHFKKSTTISVTQFNNITTTGGLNIVTATSANAIHVDDLAVDDIIEFVDQYGKKGLIRIKAINPGNESDKYIKIAIKIQSF